MKKYFHVAENDKRGHKQQYSVAECLKCGLCLGACPVNIETITSIMRMNRK